MSRNSNQNEPAGRDWFLIGIVGGIGLLVIVALVIALRGPSEVEYRTGSGPDDIAFNYLLALHKEDYETAYGYLYPKLEAYPSDIDRFQRQIVDLSGYYYCSDHGSNLRYEIEEVDLIGDRAIVDLLEKESSRSRSIFDIGFSYTNRVVVELIETEAGWRLVDSDRCWPSEWQLPESSDTNERQSG